MTSARSSRGIAGLVKADAEKRRVGVTSRSSSRCTDMPMDRGQMEQVLLNVLKNALEAIGRTER